MKEVIIKVYVESSRVVFPYYYKKEKGRKNKKIKLFPKPLKSTTHHHHHHHHGGYDRRAQLLAYAQNLRHGQNYEWPFNSKHHYNHSASRKKIRRRLPGAECLSQICLFCHKFFFRLQNKERYYRGGDGSYEQIVTEDYTFGDRLITTPHNKNAKTRAKQGKLRAFIKQFATCCCWKCHGSANIN